MAGNLNLNPVGGHLYRIGQCYSSTIWLTNQHLTMPTTKKRGRSRDGPTQRRKFFKSTAMKYTPKRSKSKRYRVIYLTGAEPQTREPAATRPPRGRYSAPTRPPRGRYSRRPRGGDSMALTQYTGPRLKSQPHLKNNNDYTPAEATQTLWESVLPAIGQLAMDYGHAAILGIVGNAIARQVPRWMQAPMHWALVTYVNRLPTQQAMMHSQWVPRQIRGILPAIVMGVFNMGRYAPQATNAIVPYVQQAIEQAPNAYAEADLVRAVLNEAVVEVREHAPDYDPFSPQHPEQVRPWYEQDEDGLDDAVQMQEINEYLNAPAVDQGQSENVEITNGPDGAPLIGDEGSFGIPSGFGEGPAYEAASSVQNAMWPGLK